LKATGDGGGAGGMPSIRVERVFSAFWVEAVMIAWEMSCDMEKEGGMTGVAVLVDTVAIVFGLVCSRYVFGNTNW